MKESNKSLINAIKAGSKLEISTILRNYKQPNGVVYYPALFAIPNENRLPYMAKQDFGATVAVVCPSLTLAFETMNLNRGLNDLQIVDLAETVIESSEEDNLSLEDLMLFLQKLTRGEYGKLYESMDIPKFMEFFEIYREERFQAMQDLRYEQCVQHKALPINDRLIDMFGSEKNRQREALNDYLKNKPE